LVLCSIEFLAAVVGLADCNFEALVLSATVSDLKVKEAAIIFKLHLSLSQLSNYFLLFITVSTQLHARDTNITNLLL
jgi:hypothetical protein